MTLLKKVAENRGFKWVEPAEADLIMCSVCDVDDLSKLKKARKIAGEKPLIMGGLETFSGEPWLAWADYLWVGEAWDFFDTLADEGWEAVKKHRSMFSKEKREAKASQRVNWQEVPLVKTGKAVYHFLAGRGCSNRCSFCFTSWAKKYQQAPESLLVEVQKVMESKPGNVKLHFISNDHLKVPVGPRLVNPTIRIRDFLKDPTKFSKSRSFHFGIERFSEAGRKEWKKPIKNEELTQLYSVLERTNQECELFFIVGMPGTEQEFEEFLTTIPVEIKNRPRLFMKMTYLDPTPFTPLARYDVRQLGPVNREKIYGELISRSKRWRSYQVRQLAAETWRCLFRRCNDEEVLKLGNAPTKQIPYKEWLQQIEQKGLGHLLDGQQEKMPWGNIEP